jgi:hypothetical protein
MRTNVALLNAFVETEGPLEMDLKEVKVKGGMK